MARAYLGIGTNLGDRVTYLQGAVDGLRRAAGVDVVDVSSIYETAPIGGPEQGAFLNAVVAVDTDLDPIGLLRVAQQLETEAERVRIERWGPRTLDVDVLMFGTIRSDDPELLLPHPRMTDRAFVLIPLAEIAPELTASLGVTIPADQDVRRFAEGLQ